MPITSRPRFIFASAFKWITFAMFRYLFCMLSTVFCIQSYVTFFRKKSQPPSSTLATFHSHSLQYHNRFPFEGKTVFSDFIRRYPIGYQLLLIVFFFNLFQCRLRCFLQILFLFLIAYFKFNNDSIL